MAQIRFYILILITSAACAKGTDPAPFKYHLKISEQEIRLVEDWNVSTPWQKLAAYKFRAENISELSNNTLMVGKHQERIIKHDSMSITLAVTSDLSHRTDLIEQTLEKVLPVYKDIFGELPRTNYLICISQNFFEDGEAYYNSFHQMLVDQDLEHRKIVWANVLAHEMFHYWNGTHFLVGRDQDRNSWFSEGFTEYYSNLALIRSGLVSQGEYLGKLAFQFSRLYSSQAFVTGKQPNLLDAGLQKGINWHLIYGGGASMAFILDVEIRNTTSGEKSLDDYMRALYLKFGKSQQPITLRDQILELNALTKSDFASFFDKYVTGNEFYLIPILQACQKAGLTVAQYQGEFFLKPRPKGENEILQAITETP